MQNTIIQNRYRIETELGHGGMGVVYRAYDLSLERPVALKMVLAQAASDQDKLRLVTEALLTARLTHPHIVAVYDAGEHNGMPYIVMELVEGQTLRQWLENDPPGQRLAQVIPIARQICAALEYAHSHNIIHRDLKPENIFLTHHDHVKLMDFGLARSQDTPRVTQADGLVGTFAYLAPEIIIGQPPSLQSDLYALGMVLYELTTGQLPFQGNVAALLAGHLHQTPRPPSSLEPAVPPELDFLILRLLEKQPADRPASASQVRETLESATNRNIPEIVRAVRQERLASRHNLPAQLTSFVGREKDILTIKQRLLPYEKALSRLITLTGSGGTGKTRLALQIASELVLAFPDGVWLVEFAPVTDPALVPQTLLSVLGLQNEQERSALHILIDYIQDKTILLVFDNCEHLIQPCARLAEALLQAGSNAWILATSRESLEIAGETVIRLASLSLPENEAATPEALLESESARLFVERAQAALPGFDLTTENIPAIARICQRLDGIPLAIELAAARVKALRVEQIAARLDDRFRLLTGGSRTALPRQQTLRALIDWSYNLLSENERALLQRVSVFANGWTLEAAEAVCASPDLDVLDTLAQLVNKSLVVVDRQPNQDGRYTMLETIRQYAREKLLDTAEIETLRQRHLEFFVQFAEGLEAQLVGPAQIDALNQVDTEYQNICAALEWAISFDNEMAYRLGGSVVQFWSLRGQNQEGLAWLQKVLALPSPQAPLARAKVLNGLGYMAQLFYVGPQWHSARAYYEESLPIWRALGSSQQKGYMHALRLLGDVLYQTGEKERGRALVEESLAMARAARDRVEEGWSLLNLSWILGAEKQADQAHDLLVESLACHQAEKIPNGMAFLILRLGYEALEKLQLDQARSSFEQSLDWFRKLDNQLAVSETLWALGSVEFLARQYNRAEAYYLEGLAIARKLNFKNGLLGCLSDLTRVYYFIAKIPQAQKCLTDYLALANEKDLLWWKVLALFDFAALAEADHQPHRAIRLAGASETLRQAHGHFRNFQDQMWISTMLEKMHAQVDEAAFQAAWQVGAAMTLEDALAYACSTPD